MDLRLLRRVLTRTLPEGMSESFVYNDGQGCLQSDGANCANVISPRTSIHTDFNGDSITTAYDVMGRVISVVYSKDSNTEIYTYYDNSQVHTVTDQHGVTEYIYDNRDRLEAEIKPSGELLEYSYDDVGNRESVSVTRNGVVTSLTTYTYDSLNRLETVTDTSGATTYTYDAVGNLNTVTYPNGLVTDYDYNSINQLTDVYTRDSFGALISHYAYTLTPTGRREVITELDGRTTAYCYDTMYRLTDEVIFDSPVTPIAEGCLTDTAGANYISNYEYDWVGNRTYETVDGVQTAYQYDDNDRLEQSGGTNYFYDDNGNTLTETLDGNIITYVWDAKNKLSSVTKDGVTTSYTYNHSGIRSSKTESGVTTEFVVDHNRDYAQVLEEVENDTAAVFYSYGHDLLNQERDNTISFYHYDGLGSTRALSDELGELTDSYDYEAFGEVLSQTGSTVNDYKFQGEQYDNTLGQIYLRARYYDPASGRFTQMDTYQGNNFDPVSLHKYLGMNADPVMYNDPTGNFSMGSVMSGLNVMGRLVNTAMTVHSIAGVFGAVNDPDASATDVAKEVVLSMLPTKFLRIFSKGCKKNSFEEGTLVLTYYGQLPIEYVELGDLVVSINEATQEVELNEVTHIISSKKIQNIYTVTLDDGTAIRLTEEHPFYVEGEWVEAKDVVVGDSLLDYQGNEISIVNVSVTAIEIKVYNLTVANNHNYFVGDTPVLAHNINLCNFAKGYANAQAQALMRLGTLTGSKKRQRVVVGAFDVSRPGQVAVGVSGPPPAMVHSHLKNKLTKVFGSGAQPGGMNGSLCGHPLGVCAEFHAANKLLYKQAKYKNIFFTQPMRLEQGGVDACENCQSMGFDWEKSKHLLQRSAPILFR